MWLAHKPVHITTLIGHGESDPVQPSILGGPGSLVINGLGYFPKKEPTYPLRERERDLSLIWFDWVKKILHDVLYEVTF